MTNLLKNLKQKTNIDNQENSKILVDTLVKLGVDRIFGYPGASVLSIYNELSKTNLIKHYLVRHEQAAVHAAEGYARVSGKPGVVLVTSGPGFTNTITGIANAYADSTPLVVLAGDVSVKSSRNKIFQDVNIVEICKTCSKKTYKLSYNDNIAEIIQDALYTANSGKKGPVVVALPRKILESKSKNFLNITKTNNYIKKDFSIQINQFIDKINYSKRPLILIGGGCIDSIEEVRKLAEKLSCPIVSTLMGIGIYPSKSQNYLGMIGINGTRSANFALENCDLLISLGVSFSDRSTCKNQDFTKKTKIISINLESFSNNLELEIIADIKEFLTQLFDKNIIIKNNFSWKNQFSNIIQQKQNKKQIINNKLHSSFVIETISEYTKQLEPIIVTDVGQHQMLTAQFFNFTKPRKFITSGGLGTMGFGLPAAIGAQIAKPNSLVLNITGDGSFQMNLQELATCREHNIPVKIIIMNNSYLGMVRQLQEKIYNSRYQVEMINPDFTKIAEAYDLFAIRITKKEELINGINEAINHKGTAIIDIMIDSFEDI